jgi:YtkA-like protein
MTRRMLVVGLMAAVVAMATSTVAMATDMKVVKSQKAKDVTVTISNETGKWSPGKNEFMLEFVSADKKPVDVGKVTLNTAMPMPGMAPMVTGAKVQPEGPGRYRGVVDFPDSGDRQVTVNWDGPAGKGSTKFTVPVR